MSFVSPPDFELPADTGGNNVYDVESTPRVGQTAKFETYSAEYVGSGS